MKHWFNRILTSLIFGPFPEFPGGSGSGVIAPGLRYLALFVEGVPGPVAVLILRRQATGGESRSGVMGMVAAVKRGEPRPPEYVEWQSLGALIRLSVDSEARLVTLYDQKISWHESNLVIIDGRQGNAVDRWPTERHLVTLPATRELQSLKEGLRMLAPVRVLMNEA